MDIEGQLECLFSAQLKENDGQSVIEVPATEITLGDIDTETTYQVAILSDSLTERDEDNSTSTEYADATTSAGTIPIQSDSSSTPDVSLSSSAAQSSVSSPAETQGDNNDTANTDTNTTHTETDRPDPPVDEGEQRIVTIEDTGDYGDGLTRVERGFVVIVPDATEGDRVAIEITSVKETVAFADVVERFDTDG
jgi:predicted RNA-binding protein with TRAM domain